MCDQRRFISFVHSPIASFLKIFSATFFICLATAVPSAGQWIGKQTGCYADAVQADPNRPTVANPADVTQYGVLELEYGMDQLWLEDSSRSNSAGGLLKFGLLCDVEIRWNTTSFLSLTDSSGTRRGFGDNWIGPHIRLYRQTPRVPSIAFTYAVKIPSASAEKNLGSGQVDHSITFLASKDLAKTHFDFNATEYLIGRPNQSGFGRMQQYNLALSHDIKAGFQFTFEFYGNTRLDRSTPGFASSLWALTYTVMPRLVIDGGFEAGLGAGGPHRHAFVGATYSIANLYPGFKRNLATLSSGKNTTWTAPK